MLDETNQKVSLHGLSLVILYDKILLRGNESKCFFFFVFFYHLLVTLNLSFVTNSNIFSIHISLSIYTCGIMVAWRVTTPTLAFPIYKDKNAQKLLLKNLPVHEHMKNYNT